MKLCEGIFATSNLISIDFDDVQVFEVEGRDFPQHSSGTGVHVEFSISWQALGKVRREAREVLAGY